MFKVSFTNDFKKVQTFNDRATVVTLRGKCTTPEWFDRIPQSIKNWIDLHPSIDVDEVWDHNGDLIMIITAIGKSVCTEEDIFDAALGERIAESRAKVKLYKFMCNLCEQLLRYYYGIVYGNSELGKVIESHSEPPKDCVYVAFKKYQALLIKESHHLGSLLEEA